MRKTLSLTAATLALLVGSVAYAAEVPSITLTALTTANATTSSALVGTQVYAKVQLATASTTLARPAGTVDITVYPNTSCAGTGTTQAGIVLADGGAQSSASTTATTGLSFKARYNGQPDVFTVVDSSCVAVAAQASTVTISHTLSSTSVATGTSVTSLATLGGATAAAGGTVSYAVFSNNACTTQYVTAGTRSVVNASTTASDSVAFSTPGTYYWRALYSGDSANSAATSSCIGMTVTSSAIAVPTTTPTTTPASIGTITGVVFNDINKNRVRDAGEVGIAGVKVNLFKGWGFWKRNGAPTATATTDSNGVYTFTGLADGTYSVEEVVPSGWRQISSDFRGVVLQGGVGVGGKDFANVEKAPKASKPKETRIDKAEKKIKKLEEKIAKWKSRGSDDGSHNGRGRGNSDDD